MTGIEFKGLSEFQKDLLVVAEKEMPREVNRMMRKVGNRLATHVRREARSKVVKRTGNYYKRFKRGKVFRDNEGKTVVRVFNSAPHAHLIEYGHNIVRDGKVVGFSPGKLVVGGAQKKFDASGELEKIVSEELDRMLREAGL